MDLCKSHFKNSTPSSVDPVGLCNSNSNGVIKSSNTFTEEYETSLALAQTVANHICKKDIFKPRLTKNLISHCETAKRVASDIMSKHDKIFTGMAKRLEIKKQSPNEVVQSLERVLSELFSDGHTNWGRIATVYTFGGCICKYSLDNNKSELVHPIVETVASFISDKKSSWIRQQDGWDAFDNFFQEQKSLEVSLWQGLFYTFIGLGALAFSFKSS